MAENTQQPLPESPLVFDESPITTETKQDRRLSDEWGEYQTCLSLPAHENVPN